MKKIFTATLIAGFAACLSAQITVTSASFPAAGDTLRTATDIAPTGIDITAPGGPYDWDFSSLSLSAIKQETVFRAASEGTAFNLFPEAELFTDLGGGTETYYSVSANSFDNLGFNGPDPAGIGVFTQFKFTSPVPLRHAPLTFPATFNSSSDVFLAFSTDDLPQALLDSLDISALADSIRVRVTTNRDDFVDAYGKLTIPGGTYDVLREKRTEFRETRLDVHTFIGWVDVTDLVAGSFAGLGADTILTYNFFSNDAKEPIAVVTMDDAGQAPAQVAYKDNGVVSSTPETVAGAPELVVWPNPASSSAVFLLKNIAPGDYSLRILDLQGRLVLDQPLAGPKTTVQLGNLPAGAYAYIAVDSAGVVKGQGKLVVQR